MALVKHNLYVRAAGDVDVRELMDGTKKSLFDILVTTIKQLEALRQGLDYRDETPSSLGSLPHAQCW